MTKKLIGGGLCLLAVLLSGDRVGAQDAPALYTQYCGSCHDTGSDRAPTREALRSLTPERVLQVMEAGTMIAMANPLSAADRRAVAEEVAGKPFSTSLPTTPSAAAMCPNAPGGSFDPASGPQWNGWGAGILNTRYRDAESAGLSADDVPRLKLKWVFGFPGDVQSHAHATIAGGRVFVGSLGGRVYSLDAGTGCVHWFYTAEASVRTAVSIGLVETRAGSVQAAFFGDATGNVYGVEAATGRPLWKTEVEEHPAARITGSPVFHDGRLYVPVSSFEEGTGSLPDYECCTFRGSVVALDGATGGQIWKSYTVDEPTPRARNRVGTQLRGPSGAPIWSSPAIDVERNALYVTTGDNYSEPVTETSDAFIAMDLSSGRILWTRQTTAGDAYVSGCRLPDKTNCPESNGPDFDFAASPMLVTLPSGRRAVIAGQKSGIVHALDPDRQGEVIWQTRVGIGGSLGGVQWGSAADASRVYVALSDVGRVMLTFNQFTDADRTSGGGMSALRLSDGEPVWSAPPVPCDDRPRCSPAQSAAVTAIPGVAFSGSLDGHMRAYSTEDGTIVWDFDTVRSYETVNGVQAWGGSIDGPGPAVGGGMVFVNSGYPTTGGMTGNVLLAFSVDGR